AMNLKLQRTIPGQIGRYDDGFNDNCVGDSFQMQGVPTILFEAGHYQNDYEREKTREFIFDALVEALRVIAKSAIEDYSTEEYFKIPENQKLFYDILLKNAYLINANIQQGKNVGIRYKEVLENQSVMFVPEIVDVGELDGFFGHDTYDCSKKEDMERLSSRKNIIDLLRSVRK
ncbi:MAG: peptidase M14, partial [Allomuricauda sp.]